MAISVNQNKQLISYFLKITIIGVFTQIIKKPSKKMGGFPEIAGPVSHAIF